MKFDAALDRSIRLLSDASFNPISGLKESLIAAAAPHGKFPMPSAVLDHIRAQSRVDQTAGAAAEAVYQDPLMALRLVGLANSAAYAHVARAETVSDAIKQMGIARIGKVLADAAKAEDYRRLFLGRTVALTAFQEFSLAVILAGELAGVLGLDGHGSEMAQILAMTLNLPAFLLAFFKPSLYSIVALTPEIEVNDRARRLKEMLGVDAATLGREIAKAFSLPAPYETALQRAGLPARPSSTWEKKDEPTRAMLASAQVAGLLAQAVFRSTRVGNLKSRCQVIAKEFCINFGRLAEIVPAAALALNARLQMLGLKTAHFPRSGEGEAGDKGDKHDFLFPRSPAQSGRMESFLLELQTCLKTRAADEEYGYTPHALYCTLLALLKAADFHRAILFVPDNESECLQPALCLGLGEESMYQLLRAQNSEASEEMRVRMVSSRQKATFSGSQLFEDGWPFVEFPIIWQGQVLGVFYADRVVQESSSPLSLEEQVSIVALAEEWHDVPADFC